MIAHLILCYVDTQRISHSQKMVREITDYINYAQAFDHGFTFLFKEEDMESIIRGFDKKASSFLNDPLKMYWDEEDEEESDFSYPPDFRSLYIQFVSSRDLFETFCAYARSMDTYNCDICYIYTCNISCLDQMEILKKLQEPQNDFDIVNKIILYQGVGCKLLYKKLYKSRKN